MLPDFVIQHERQFREELIIIFPFTECTFVGIFDTCYIILVGYAEIFPKVVIRS
nr:MAG TPA: hypothetical protein [Caudoviricetes sp.]